MSETTQDWKERRRRDGLRAWDHQTHQFDILELSGDRGFRLVDMREETMEQNGGEFAIEDYATLESAMHAVLGGP